MEEDSPGGREEGRTFWGGLRAFLFGDDGEASLRDEIEEALESREGEAPRVGDLSAAERQMMSTVSSPARVPSTSCHSSASKATAIGCAPPGRVWSTISSPTPSMAVKR